MIKYCIASKRVIKYHRVSKSIVQVGKFDIKLIQAICCFPDERNGLSNTYTASSNYETSRENKSSYRRVRAGTLVQQREASNCGGDDEKKKSSIFGKKKRLKPL